MSFCYLFFLTGSFVLLDVKLELFVMLKLHLGPQKHSSLLLFALVLTSSSVDYFGVACKTYRDGQILQTYVDYALWTCFKLLW